jgi:hypothetical protein
MRTMYSILETTQPFTKKYMNLAVNYGLIEEYRQMPTKKWRGVIYSQGIYHITEKGRLYLSKMRALWALALIESK